MYIEEKNSNFILKTRIDIGDFFEQPDNEVFVMLKEPTTLQYLKLQASWQKEDKDQIIIDFYEIFPEIIADHALYHTESKKMTNKEATETLFSKYECITYVMQKYYEFLSESKKKLMMKKEKSKQ